jgi:aquaporin rerated protein, other eukaryote
LLVYFLQIAAHELIEVVIAPIGIGLALFIAELMGVYYTGGAVNPARSFGPSVVSHQFHGYHWIYWVGPFLGSLLASGFYKFIKMLEYETANPGQDRGEEGEHFNPDLAAHDPRVSFAPSDYAMEEGLSHDPRNPQAGDGVRQPPSGVAVKKNGPSNIGEPIEYGEAHRPYSASPAPPHPNDQFAGLAEGGMHATEYVKADTPSTASGSTLNTTAPGAGIAGTGTNPATGATTAPAAKGALKKNRQIASRNETYSNGGSAGTLSANTANNRTGEEKQC